MNIYKKGEKVSGVISKRGRFGEKLDVTKKETGTVIDTLHGQGIGGADLLKVEIEDTKLLQLWFIGEDEINKIPNF